MPAPASFGRGRTICLASPCCSEPRLKSRTLRSTRTWRPTCSVQRRRPTSTWAWPFASPTGLRRPARHSPSPWPTRRASLPPTQTSRRCLARHPRRRWHYCKRRWPLCRSLRSCASRSVPHSAEGSRRRRRCRRSGRPSHSRPRLSRRRTRSVRRCSPRRALPRRCRCCAAREPPRQQTPPWYSGRAPPCRRPTGCARRRSASMRRCGLSRC